MGVIICDTRQKPSKTKYIQDQLEDLGFTILRSKMLVGDYQVANKGDVVVDTKQDMHEVESNLVHDHERFRNECKLAQEAGIQLYILIQDPRLKRVEDVFSWYNVRQRWSPRAATGRQLAKMMLSMHEKYGVKWRFCTKSECGKTILDLLGVNE